MTPELSSRIASAFQRGLPSPEERERVLRAVEAVDYFSELPPSVQAAIVAMEKKRRPVYWPRVGKGDSTNPRVRIGD